MGYCLYLPAPQPWRSHQSDRPLGRRCLQRTQLSRLGSSPRHPHNQIFYTVNTLLPHQRPHSATFNAGTHCDHINVSKIPVTVVRFLYKMGQATRLAKDFNASWLVHVHRLTTYSLPACRTGAVYHSLLPGQQSIHSSHTSQNNSHP